MKKVRDFFKDRKNIINIILFVILAFVNGYVSYIFYEFNIIIIIFRCAFISSFIFLLCKILHNLKNIILFGLLGISISIIFHFAFYYYMPYISNFSNYVIRKSFLFCIAFYFIFVLVRTKKQKLNIKIPQYTLIIGLILTVICEICEIIDYSINSVELIVCGIRFTSYFCLLLFFVNIFKIHKVPFANNIFFVILIVILYSTDYQYHSYYWINPLYKNLIILLQYASIIPYFNTYYKLLNSSIKQ